MRSTAWRGSPRGMLSERAQLLSRAGFPRHALIPHYGFDHPARDAVQISERQIALRIRFLSQAIDALVLPRRPLLRDVIGAGFAECFGIALHLILPLIIVFVQAADEPLSAIARATCAIGPFQRGDGALTLSRSTVHRVFFICAIPRAVHRGGFPSLPPRGGTPPPPPPHVA